MNKVKKRFNSWREWGFSNELDLSNLRLKVFPKFLEIYIPFIKYLNISNNWLKELPSLPNCIILYCSKNRLENLPSLPKCKELDCSKNRIKVINLPMCKKLECRYNIVDKLDINYDIIEYLDCSYNRLVTINSMPNCEILKCNANSLIDVPFMKSCKKLRCYYNKDLKRFKVSSRCEEILRFQK